MQSIIQLLIPYSGQSNDHSRCHPVRQIFAPVLSHCYLKLCSIYLGEDTRQRISQQIDQFISSGNPIQSMVLIIDIVCMPEAISPEIARQLSQETLRFIDLEYPEIRDRFVGVSDDQYCLPLRDLLLTRRLMFGEIDNQHLFIFE